MYYRPRTEVVFGIKYVDGKLILNSTYKTENEEEPKVLHLQHSIITSSRKFLPVLKSEAGRKQVFIA